MRRIAPLIVGLALSASLFTRAQSQSFEVVSVKPAPPGTQNSGVQMSPSGRVTWTNVTLQAMVNAAYQRFKWDSREIVGGPDWYNEARFDVVAVAAGGLPPPDADGFPSQLLAMIRAVLEDRFKLVVHWETRVRPIYNLVLDRADARLGPKLVPVTVDCGKVGAAIVAGNPQAPRPGRGLECNFSLTAEPGWLQGNAVTMAVLARFLGVEGAGREVVDRTGLSGTFDIDVLYLPELPFGNASAEKLALDPKFAGRAGLVTSLREQLGLKLEPAQGPVQALVIDRAERPTAN
jgi:uncharacterized protein (TIGR03435 family)